MSTSETTLTQGHQDRLLDIPVDKITPSRFQPRKKFDEDALAELADSIRENELAQPIVVFMLDEKDGTYELIAGERRTRAFQILKRETIPAVVKSLTLEQVRILALIENLQREDLTLMEEAESISTLVLENDNNIQLVASRIGKGRSATYIQDRLILVTLPIEIKAMVDKKEISIAQAKVIAGLAEESDQVEMAKRAVKLKLNADQLKGQTQNKHKKTDNTGGGSNTAGTTFKNVSTSLVHVYEVIEKYDFSMLRDENKRSTLRNQIALVQRSLAETMEKLVAPANPSDSSDPEAS